MLNLNYKTIDYPKVYSLQTTFISCMPPIRKKKRAVEAGFSLLESLVAVAVVSILIVSIAPMVALSTSARVNARRVDQATQAARSYIDGVRGEVIETANFPDDLVAPPSTQAQYQLEAAAPTSAILNLNSTTVPGVKIDTNGDGFSVDDPQDLVIQPIRSGPRLSVNGTSTSTDLRRQGFWIAVRVYRASAFTGGATIRTGTEELCSASKLLFSSSASLTCPIVVMRSQILPTNSGSNNFGDLKSGTGSEP